MAMISKFHSVHLLIARCRFCVPTHKKQQDDYTRIWDIYVNTPLLIRCLIHTSFVITTPDRQILHGILIMALYGNRHAAADTHPSTGAAKA